MFNEIDETLHGYILQTEDLPLVFQILLAYACLTSESVNQKGYFARFRRAIQAAFPQPIAIIDQTEIAPLAEQLIIKGQFPARPSPVMPFITFSPDPVFISTEQVYFLLEAILCLQRHAKGLTILQTLQLQQKPTRSLNELLQMFTQAGFLRS